MKAKLLIFLFLAADGLLLLYLLLHQGTLISPGILAPTGPIATRERDLLVFAFILAMIVILPVFAIYFYIASTYREGKQKTYAPDWNPRFSIKLLWWAIPALFVAILAVRTWYDTHALDPYQPLTSDAKPVKIQVVALRWKWLFLYPEEGIATVNFIQFPTHRPVNFELTADAPMNSFWIPRLSGQIYAMTGMSTKLHLQADTPGDYPGSAAEISGAGFSGMRFIARANSEEAYQSWIADIKQSAKPLTQAAYQQLTKPSEKTPAAFYVLDDTQLYNEIIKKYMPSPAEGEPGEMNGMHM